MPRDRYQLGKSSSNEIGSIESNEHKSQALRLCADLWTTDMLTDISTMVGKIFATPSISVANEVKVTTYFLSTLKISYKGKNDKIFTFESTSFRMWIFVLKYLLGETSSEKNKT